MWIVGSSFRPRLPEIHGCTALSLAVESTGRAREGAALQPCTAVDQHRTRLWIFRSESFHTGVYGDGAPEPGPVAANAIVELVSSQRGGDGFSDTSRIVTVRACGRWSTTGTATLPPRPSRSGPPSTGEGVGQRSPAALATYATPFASATVLSAARYTRASPSSAAALR